MNSSMLRAQFTSNSFKNNNCFFQTLFLNSLRAINHPWGHVTYTKQFLPSWFRHFVTFIVLFLGERVWISWFPSSTLYISGEMFILYTYRVQVQYTVVKLMYTYREQDAGAVHCCAVYV